MQQRVAKGIARATLIVGVLFLTGACATSQEWTEWRAHSSHFASGQHLVFSTFRNPRDASPPNVRRSDVEAARTESWWGKAVTVSPDQIFRD
jgi:hypothetical protein